MGLPKIKKTLPLTYPPIGYERRLEACKDAISGLLNIYFINYGDLSIDDVTYVDNAANSDVIATWTPASAINLYKYELKGANGFEQTIQTSRHRTNKLHGH